MRRYVIVESASVGVTVMDRQADGGKWTVTILLADEILLMPEIGVEIPVADLYEGLNLPGSDPSAPETTVPLGK